MRIYLFQVCFNLAAFKLGMMRSNNMLYLIMNMLYILANSVN